MGKPSLLKALAKPRSCAGSVPVFTAASTEDATFAGIPGSSALDGDGAGTSGPWITGGAIIGTPEPLAPFVVATAPTAPFWGGVHDEGRASFSPGRREAKLPSLPFVFCGLAATSSGQRAPCPVKWAAIFQG